MGLHINGINVASKLETDVPKDTPTSMRPARSCKQIEEWLAESPITAINTLDSLEIYTAPVVPARAEAQFPAF